MHSSNEYSAMHFSIPDTADILDPKGSSYTVFNIHINGVYHCSVRYRQFNDFYTQLKKEFGASILPSFPPKKLLPLTPSQLDERRFELERFIQQVSQISTIANSPIFNGFLLNAQQESQHERPEDASLDVYLANGHKITVKIQSTDQTEDVLEAVASHIELSDQFVYYFGLFLVCKDSASDSSIVRKLQDFESPFISLKSSLGAGTHWIVLRKTYWDSAYDEDLLDDRVSMNLLYVQAENDVDRSWVTVTKEQSNRLASLQQRGSKKEYLRFVRTLKYYGHIIFKPCMTDYPTPDTKVLIAAGNRELNFRLQLKDGEKEIGFKVTRMRCWRISSGAFEQNGSRYGGSRLELAFEYLMAKNKLQWITLFSTQAILMSMCLQGMVDELIMKKEGRRFKRPQDRGKSSGKSGSLVRLPSSPTEHNGPEISETPPLIRLPGPYPSANSKVPMSMGFNENNAFDGIRDDDL